MNSIFGDIHIFGFNSKGILTRNQTESTLTDAKTFISKYTKEWKKAGISTILICGFSNTRLYETYFSHINSNTNNRYYRPENLQDYFEFFDTEIIEQVHI